MIVKGLRPDKVKPFDEPLAEVVNRQHFERFTFRMAAHPLVIDDAVADSDAVQDFRAVLRILIEQLPIVLKNFFTGLLRGRTGMLEDGNIFFEAIGERPRVAPVVCGNQSVDQVSGICLHTQSYFIFTPFTPFTPVLLQGPALREVRIFESRSQDFHEASY